MDAVLAMCKASASYLAQPADKINYHGIDVEQYKPVQDKASHWQSVEFSGKPKVVAQYGIAILGRVRKQKGTHLFVQSCIEVLPKYPEYTALVIGAISASNKSFVKELQDKIEAAGLNERIVFAGEQTFSDIPKIFSSLSLVAALSDNEGFGLTILEAMSSETAVIATEAGAWPEVIRADVDGCIVPVNALDAIKKKLDYLLSDAERLAQMGKNGRERVLEHYTVEREAKDLCTFFRTLQ